MLDYAVAKIDFSMNGFGKLILVKSELNVK
jgi:hypothetical protein